MSKGHLFNNSCNLHSAVGTNNAILEAVEPATNLKDGFSRLKTFPLQWPHIPSKKRFVDFGFYYISEQVACAFCSLRVSLTPSCCEVQLEHSDCPLQHNLENGNVPLIIATNYRLEKNRLISFLVLNWTSFVDPYELAKSGFFALGSADATRCAFCRLEVQGWEQGDTPQGEHEKWNANCPFLTRQPVGNVRLGDDEDAAENLSPDRVAVLAMRNVTVTGSVRSARELGITELTPPKHPEYAPSSSRLSSYQMWPKSMRQTPERLAEAGFYYTGRGDRVICYQCGGGLKDWGHTDDPWIEHAAWFPNCSHLTKNKGIDFVNKVQQLKQAKLSNEELRALTQTSITAHTPADATANEAQSTAAVPPTEISALKGTPEASASSAGDTTRRREVPFLRACKVCLTSELGIIFLPCGHVATCVDCAAQVACCPVCRGTINAYVRTYLP